MDAYLAAFICSILWVFASQLSALIIKRISVFRFNFYKSVISFVCFFATALFIGKLTVSVTACIPWLIISGIIGFGIADLFMYYSFYKIGPARTLMIASFRPSIIAILAYFILGQMLSPIKVLGLIFLIVCLYFLGMEKKKRGSVSWQDMSMALIGILLDAVGIVFSKKAFLLDPMLQSATANVYRIFPCIILLAGVNYIINIKMGVSDLSKKMKIAILGSSFTGTFLALLLFLYAISMPGHPSIITGITSLTPLYASIYEHIRDKEYPNKYFICAIISTMLGVVLLFC